MGTTKHMRTPEAAYSAANISEGVRTVIGWSVTPIAVPDIMPRRRVPVAIAASQNSTG